MLLNSKEYISVGKETYYNGNIKLIASKDSKIEIGSFCSIGPNLKILTLNHDYNYPTTQGKFYYKYFNKKHPGEKENPSKTRTKGLVKIGHDVWVGEDVTILSGVTIGNGVCIATGSIVTKDLPSYTICAGVPCKVVKNRFSQEKIEYFNKLEWWDWSPAKIKKNIDFFTLDISKSSLSKIKEKISNQKKYLISIVYLIPKRIKSKYHHWHDGFTRAIELLRKDYSIDMINFFDQKDIDYNKYDLVILKEGFEGPLYKNFETYISKYNKKTSLALCISSSATIPTQEQLNRYDLLFYETNWFYDFGLLYRHPRCHHAFGIDIDAMKPLEKTKKYDAIFVGNIVGYKRPLKLLDIPGKKIVIGPNKNDRIKTKLQEAKIKIKDFLPYTELSNYYNQSKLCYVPCELHGGGERAVLEARACGIPVKIEPDNEKLKELLTSPIYSSYYYCDQLKKGIDRLRVSRNFPDFDKIISSFYGNNTTILQVGAMDGKNFDPLFKHTTEKINQIWQVYTMEPIKKQFLELEQNYQNHQNVKCLNFALNYTSDEKEMYTISDTKTVENKDNISFVNGISSFYKDRNSIGEKYWKEGRGKNLKKFSYEKDIKPFVVTEKVNCITIEELSEKYNIKNIHILQIDTEGFDYHIVKMVLSKFKPLIINFEWNNLPQNEWFKCLDILSEYEIKVGKQDALAVLNPCTSIITRSKNKWLAYKKHWKISGNFVFAEERTFLKKRTINSELLDVSSKIIVEKGHKIKLDPLNNYYRYKIKLDVSNNYKLYQDYFIVTLS